MGLVPSIWFRTEQCCKGWPTCVPLRYLSLASSTAVHHTTLGSTMHGAHGGPEPVGGPRERFLDDVYTVTSPDRMLAVFTILQAELWRLSRIRVHDGKTQVWNASGLRPEGRDFLDRAGRAVNPEFDTVWRGDGPTITEGLKVLGHEDFLRDHLRRATEDDMSLLVEIPSLPDVHCASARTNYMLRAIRPVLIVQFSADHNAGLWSCLCNILRIAPDQCDELAKDVASLPLCMGGLGFGNAVRTSACAFWASWADSFIGHDPCPPPLCSKDKCK